jgi:hypothetical protein
MGWFGLVGNDRAMAATTYATRESATARRDRKAKERDQAATARRRRSHHRHAAAADRAGQAWTDRTT